jgi:hypothetical protein
MVSVELGPMVSRVSLSRHIVGRVVGVERSATPAVIRVAARHVARVVRVWVVISVFPTCKNSPGRHLQHT